MLLMMMMILLSLCLPGE